MLEWLMNNSKYDEIKEAITFRLIRRKIDINFLIKGSNIPFPLYGFYV